MIISISGMTHSHSCQSMPLSQEVSTDQKSLIEENGSSSLSSSSMKSENGSTALVTSNISNQDQEALSRQLEFVRQKSRSTFLDR